MKEAEKVIAELEWFRAALIKGGKTPEYYEAQSGILAKAIKLLEQPERKKGKWIVVTRHEHYPSGKPYEQLQCPFCNRIDHNGDGNFCGYCGANMRGEQDEVN